MQNDPIGLVFLISGRVQGVFYRRFAKQSAEALGLTGWTRNLPDGRVEVQAFGTTAQLERYQTQLRRGPFIAKVKEVTSTPIDWAPHPRFIIKE